MQALKNLATFEVKIGGVSFVQHRRSTALMLEIGDVRKVFGLIPGANAKQQEDTAELAAKRKEEYVKMSIKGCQVAIISINGDLVDGHILTPADLAHVADPLFKAFLASGLEVDPTPGSSKGETEPSLPKP